MSNTHRRRAAATSTQFLVSAIGLADIGNDVIGGNRQALTDVLHLLVPTTDLLNRVPRGALVRHRRPRHRSRKCRRCQLPGIVVSAGLTLGVERYRYPADLPKVAAKGGPYCKELGLPDVQPELRPPFIVADVGANPGEVRKPGHPAELRWPQELVVRADRRPAAQHRTDRNARMTRSTRHADQVRDLRGRDGDADRVPVLHLRPVPDRVRRTGIRRCSPTRRGLKTGDTVRVAGIRVGTVDGRVAAAGHARCW